MNGTDDIKVQNLLPYSSEMYVNNGVPTSPPMHKDDAINDTSVSDSILFNGVVSFLNVTRAGDNQPIALPQQNEIVLTEK